MIEINPQKTREQSRTIPRSEGLNLAAERKAITEAIKRFSPQTPAYATQFVEHVLNFAEQIGTSDVHLQPTLQGLEVKFRHDGVLQYLGEFPVGAISSVISRLKVLSNLLTYRSDIPQEGRIAMPGDLAEVRVSTYPTLYGERAVLRFFGRGDRLKRLSDLGHTEVVVQALHDTLAETSGAMIVTGPAGSGKSTTLYACLRELVKSSVGNRNLMTLEDPIEVPISGVSQSQVNVQAGFDLHTACAHYYAKTLK